jgi:Leucine-rich repeat (LRR) protein
LTDYGLEAVKDLKQLESLDLSHNADVTDAGLRELRELKQLTNLSFFDTKVTDAGLNELQGLRQLKRLGVDRRIVTDRSLKCLADAGLLHALWLADEHGFRAKNDAEVQRLNLEETQVTDVGVKELRNLKKIEILRLWPSQITDASLRTLTEFGMLHALDRTHPIGPPLGEAWSDEWNRPKNADEIWSLSLYECDVTNASLKDLAALKKLRSLNLVRTHVTDAGLIEFPGLTQLSSLDVNRNVVTDLLLKHLANAGRVHILGIVNELAWPRPKSDAEVHSVNLYYTTVTHVGLKDLQRLKRLNNLALNEKQVTDDALKILAEIGLLHALNRAEAKSGKRPKNVNEIRVLNLHKCNVTDVSLTKLAALKSLQTLDIRETRVSDAGVKELRAALPDCEIVR